MSLLQIQPQRSDFDRWTSFAKAEKLTFEVAEPGIFFAPESALSLYCDSGLVSSLHGAFIDVNPASGDPQIRDLSRRRCEESCRIAVQLVAQCVVFHSSCFPFLRGIYMERWADECAQFYSELAEKHHLMLFIENSFDTDSAPLLALMRRKTSALVQVCLDLGHINYSREPMESWFDRLAEHIGYLHLSDNHGMFDEHLPLGSGSVDWEKADMLWQHIGKPERLTLEVGNLDNVARCVAYLKENHLFGQG